MEDLVSIIGNLLCLFFGIGIPIGFVFLLVYMVKKTQEEQAIAKLELMKLVSDLPKNEQGMFFLHYNAQRKDPMTAVLLALFLGSWGAHRFYLGQMGIGLVFFFLFWTGIPYLLAFFEVFNIGRVVIKKNREIARETVAMLTGDVTKLLGDTFINKEIK